eukprot:SM000003S11246  [mRNA]  locus=s3:1626866:1628010:- [translate_table: standard]
MQRVVRPCPVKSCRADIAECVSNPQVNREMVDVIEMLKEKRRQEELANENDNSEPANGAELLASGAAEPVAASNSHTAGRSVDGDGSSQGSPAHPRAKRSKRLQVGAECGAGPAPDSATPLPQNEHGNDEIVEDSEGSGKDEDAAPFVRPPQQAVPSSPVAHGELHLPPAGSLPQPRPQRQVLVATAFGAICAKYPEYSQELLEALLVHILAFGCRQPALAASTLQHAVEDQAGDMLELAALLAKMRKQECGRREVPPQALSCGIEGLVTARED